MDTSGGDLSQDIIWHLLLRLEVVGTIQLGYACHAPCVMDTNV